MPKLSTLKPGHPQYRGDKVAIALDKLPPGTTAAQAQATVDAAKAVPLAKEPTYDPIATAYGDPDDPVVEHMEGVNPAFYEMLEFSVAVWEATQLKRIGLNDDLTDEEGGRLVREFLERVDGLIKVHGLPINTLSGFPSTFDIFTRARNSNG